MAVFRREIVTRPSLSPVITGQGNDYWLATTLITTAGSVHCEPRRPINTFLFSSTRCWPRSRIRGHRELRPIAPRGSSFWIMPHCASSRIAAGIPWPFRGHTRTRIMLCVRLCLPLTHGVTPVSGSLSKLFPPLRFFFSYQFARFRLSCSFRLCVNWRSRVTRLLGKEFHLFRLLVVFTLFRRWLGIFLFVFFLDETNFTWKFISSFELAATFYWDLSNNVILYTDCSYCVHSITFSAVLNFPQTHKYSRCNNYQLKPSKYVAPSEKLISKFNS